MSAKYATSGLTGMPPTELGWLTGAWKGQHGADVVEEHWSEFAGGSFMAMFRWLRNDAVWFYEFMTLEPRESQLLLRIKHFYPELQGWEEKNQSAEFLLVEARPGEAVFLQTNKAGPWLIYRLESEDKLISFFDKGIEPVPPESVFVFYRQSAVTKPDD